jgi:aconitate hydratase
MGILPLQFKEGESLQTIGLSGYETFSIAGIKDMLQPSAPISVTATAKNGKETNFEVKARLDTPIDIEVYKNGGILQTVVREML